MARRMGSSWYILTLLFVAVAGTRCSLLDFAKMIKKVTGKNALHYAFYGCYCGYGGHGYPRDNTDWCCHKHDCCFDLMLTMGCHPKTTCYTYDVTDGSVTCDTLGNSLCAQRTCECDREAALCFRENLALYSFKYILYLKGIKCKGRTPECSMYMF